MTRREIEHTIEIARAPEEVFRFVDAHEDDERWRKGFVAIAQVTTGPVGIGTEYRETVKTLGRRVGASVRVRARRPGHSLVYDVAAGSSRFVVSYAFAATARGTRLTRTIDADFGPIGPVARLVAALLRRSLADDLPTLKMLIEEREPTPLAA